MRGDAYLGTADKVGGQLRDLARALGVDEVVVLTWTHDLTARKDSYTLLAREFELEGDR